MAPGEVELTVRFESRGSWTWETRRRGESMSLGVGMASPRSKSDVLARITEALEYAASDAALQRIAERLKFRAAGLAVEAAELEATLKPVFQNVITVRHVNGDGLRQQIADSIRRALARNT